MLHRSFWRLLPAMLCFALCGTARATPIYSYVFDQTNYSIASGGTIDVQVFLQEDDSTGGSAFLHDPGLIGAGVKVNFNDAIIRVASTADIHPNTGPGGFSDPSGSSTTFLTPNVSAGLMENNGLGPAVTAPGSGPFYEILLGTFTFSADDAPGHSIIITATRTAPDSQDNVGADGPPPTVLDDQILPGSATITEVPGGGGAAPEPSTVVLMTFTSVGLALAYSWRRLKRI